MVLAIAPKFTDEELKGGGGNFFVKEGWHHAMLISAGMADNFKGPEYPKDLLITGVITKGEHQHEEFDIRLSINDDSPVPNGRNGVTWAKMAYKNVFQIAEAVGFKTPPYSNLEQILRKPLMIEFKTKKGKAIVDATTGQPQLKQDGTQDFYPDRSEARGFKATPKVATAQATAPTTQQPVAAQPQPVAGNPFVSPAAQQPVQQQPIQQPMQAQQPAGGPVLDDEIPFN